MWSSFQRLTLPVKARTLTQFSLTSTYIVPDTMLDTEKSKSKAALCSEAINKESAVGQLLNHATPVPWQLALGRVEEAPSPTFPHRSRLTHSSFSGYRGPLSPSYCGTFHNSPRLTAVKSTGSYCLNILYNKVVPLGRGSKDKSNFQWHQAEFSATLTFQARTAITSSPSFPGGKSNTRIVTKP